MDGSYSYKLNTKKAKGDQVIANGVTIENGAQFDFMTVQNKKLTPVKSSPQLVHCRNSNRRYLC